MDFVEKAWEISKGKEETVILPEGDDIRTVEAAYMTSQAKICKPILLGNEKVVREQIASFGKSFEYEIIDPSQSARRKDYASVLFERRKHKGMTADEASQLTKHVLYYGAMSLALGDSSVCISGANHSTRDVLRAGLFTIGAKDGTKTISSCFIMRTKMKQFGAEGSIVFADCAVNAFPNAEQLSDIAIASAESVSKFLGVRPVVALLSYSTKGSNSGEEIERMIEAKNLVRKKRPDILVDGELQVDAAIVESIAERKAPGSKVAGKANCLIFPNVEAGNIGYKLVERFAGASAIGPISQGFSKPYDDLSRGSSSEDIANLIALEVSVL